VTTKQTATQPPIIRLPDPPADPVIGRIGARSRPTVIKTTGAPSREQVARAIVLLLGDARR
jgi:hypothetical protein